MPLESQTPSAPSETGAGPVIENEIPAYRAISSLAVLSLVLGILSVFCFADLTFLIAAVAAIVTGFLADRRIQRLPDMLTGRGLAQGGLALGLVFGLAALTTDQVQTYLRKRDASRFASLYAGVLKKGSIDECLWYRVPPQVRKNVSPTEAVQQLQKSARDPSMMENYTGPIRGIKDRLASSPQETLAFDGIEQEGLEGLDPFALALLRLAGPGSKRFPAKEEFALLVLKGKKEGNKIDWWIEELQFPYKPKTHVLQEKPVDDGHGHGH